MKSEYKKIKSADHTYYIEVGVFEREYGSDELRFFTAGKLRRMADCTVVIGEFNTIIKCGFSMEKMVDSIMEKKS